MPLHGTGRRFDPGSLHYYWDIAQLVERLAVNQNVAGSIPAIPAWGYSSIGRTSVSKTGNVGSNPTIPAFADVAQMAEQ